MHCFMENRKMARRLDEFNIRADTKERRPIGPCKNYRTIALVAQANKIMLKIVLERIRKKTESEINNEQAGFRGGRGTRDQITNLRILMQKLNEHKQPLYMLYCRLHKSV